MIKVVYCSLLPFFFPSSLLFCSSFCSCRLTTCCLSYSVVVSITQDQSISFPPSTDIMNIDKDDEMKWVHSWHKNNNPAIYPPSPGSEVTWWLAVIQEDTKNTKKISRRRTVSQSVINLSVPGSVYPNRQTMTHVVTVKGQGGRRESGWIEKGREKKTIWPWRGLVESRRRGRGRKRGGKGKGKERRSLDLSIDWILYSPIFRRRFSRLERTRWSRFVVWV